MCHVNFFVHFSTCGCRKSSLFPRDFVRISRLAAAASHPKKILLFFDLRQPQVEQYTEQNYILMEFGRDPVARAARPGTLMSW